MDIAGKTATGSVGVRSARWRRVGIAVLRGVAWALLVLGVWTVPLMVAFAVVPRGGEGMIDPWWPWIVAEVAIATLGLSMTTWWVADWLDPPEGHHVA